MAQGSISDSRIVFGPPSTFGWLRSSALDANGLEAWERPDGSKVRLPRGARLARVRGARGRPIVVKPRTQAG